MSGAARLRAIPEGSTARLAAGMTLQEALCSATGDCLAHITSHLPAVLADRDAEGLHQLRVALRRLGVALASFGDAIPACRELHSRSKAFAKALAPARELDVFLGELFEPAVAQQGECPGFEVLRRRAETLRRQAWDAALAELASPAFAAFQADIAAAGQSRAPALPETMKTAAPRLLAAQLKQVRKRGRGLREMMPRDCHRLRIALKKLRYAAAFASPLYGRKRVKQYLDKIETLQDLLGRFNDRAEVRAVLGRLTMEEAASAREQADVSFSVGLILGWHRARSERLAGKITKRWQRFKQAEPFWV
jgi:CHAD domain-containing protein